MGQKVRQSVPQNSGRELIVLDKDQINLAADLHLTPEDLILFQPGGNLGDRGKWSESGRRKLIKGFPEVPCVVLPQTVYFSETEEGRSAKVASQVAYRGHPALTLVARDPISRELMGEIFGGREALLAPDFATYLDGELVLPRSERDHLLVVAREDNEKRSDGIPDVCRRLGHPMRTTDTIASTPVTGGIRRWLVEEKVGEFAHASAVVTDRAHGAVFSFLARTPCVILPGADHKLKGLMHWFDGISAMGFAASIEEIPAVFERVRRGNFDGARDFCAELDRLPEQIGAGKTFPPGG